MIGGKMSLRSVNAGHPVLVRLDSNCSVSQMDCPTFSFNRIYQGIDQSLRATFNVAEFLLHHALARAPNTPHPGPHPCCGDIVGELVKFEVEQRSPELLIR